MAKSLNPEAITMITPSRWFTGGQGITQQWRQDWMNDLHIDTLVHYSDSREVFTNTSIGGGISYFRWVKNINNYEQAFEKNIIDFENKEISASMLRQLNEHTIFIPNKTANNIINKVESYIEKYKLNTVDGIILGRADGYYGLGATYTQEIGDIVVKQFGGDKRCYSTQLKNQPSGYRVIIPSLFCDRLEATEGNRVLSQPRVLDLNEVCNGNLLVFSGVDTPIIADNLIKYITTKTVRLLILRKMIGASITKEAYSFVPLLDFSRSYTDQDLYTMFNLTPEEIDYIEKTIKPME